MALQGDLESFGISEIFQLISQQGKTGTLEIEEGEHCARIRFLEGKLVEAWADSRPPSDFIGTLLVRSALITPAQLEHALEIQRQSLRPLGDILLRMGALRVAEFHEMLTLQHRETLFGLLDKRRGKFLFIDEPVEFEEGVSVHLETGPLLMEGFRQIDEWPQLRAAIPSESRVMIAVREAGDELSPDEGLILSLVDGVATVRDIVDRSRLGDFGGWKALTNLLTEGVIAPVVTSHRSLGAGARQARATSRALDLAASVLLLALGLGVFLGANGGRGVSQLVGAVSNARAAAKELSIRAQEWSGRRPQSLPSSLRVP